MRYAPGTRVRILPGFRSHAGNNLGVVVGYGEEPGHYTLRLDEPVGHGMDNRRWFVPHEYLELEEKQYYLASPIFCREVTS